MSNYPKAFITGGAKRIGKAITMALHRQGYDVIIGCFQSDAKAQVLQQELNAIRPQSAHILLADLTDEIAINDSIKYLNHMHPELSVLVNNASLFLRDPADNPANKSWGRDDGDRQDDEGRLDAYQQLFDIHVKAPYRLNHGLQATLSKNKGCIVNITDTHASRPLKDYSLYCQSKAALNMQTQALAKAFAPLTRVNAVAPGAIMWPEAQNALDEAKKAAIIKKTPLNRHGDPKFIADAVLFLINNAFVTGHILTVDGGRSL
jgi:pteridine reductase